MCLHADPLEPLRQQLLNTLVRQQSDCPLLAYRELAELHVRHGDYDAAVACVEMYVLAAPELQVARAGVGGIDSQLLLSPSGLLSPSLQQSTSSDFLPAHQLQAMHPAPVSASRVSPSPTSPTSAPFRLQQQGSMLSADPSFVSVPSTVTDTLADQSSLLLRAGQSLPDLATDSHLGQHPLQHGSSARITTLHSVDEGASEGDSLTYASVTTDGRHLDIDTEPRRELGFQPLSTNKSAPSFSLTSRVK